MISDQFGLFSHSLLLLLRSTHGWIKSEVETLLSASTLLYYYRSTYEFIDPTAIQRDRSQYSNICYDLVVVIVLRFRVNL